MTSINSSVAKAVPSAVAPSTGNSVSILTTPQMGPLQATVGARIIPEVPRPEDAPPISEIEPSPIWTQAVGTGMEREAGSAGAPSLPSAEFSGGLYPNSPIDSHYQSEFEGNTGQKFDGNPYGKVNNPPTRGMFTWVVDYINGIATSQDVDNAGWKERHPQQRTSHMRITPPPHGAGYAPETAVPKQQPQSPNTYKYNPQVGTEPYGSGQVFAGGYQHGRVLNSDNFGAGQTAGGIGGNQYTPTPGPPDTNSTTGNETGSGMPMWG
jgi:hypothetical protein